MPSAELADHIAVTDELKKKLDVIEKVAEEADAGELAAVMTTSVDTPA